MRTETAWESVTPLTVWARLSKRDALTWASDNHLLEDTPDQPDFEDVQRRMARTPIRIDPFVIPLDVWNSIRGIPLKRRGEIQKLLKQKRLERHLNKMRVKYAERKQRGLCVRCGAYPARQGQLCCEICQQKASDYHRNKTCSVS